jgi:hypothetical protein
MAPANPIGARRGPKLLANKNPGPHSHIATQKRGPNENGRHSAPILALQLSDPVYMPAAYMPLTAVSACLVSAVAWE